MFKRFIKFKTALLTLLLVATSLIAFNSFVQKGEAASSCDKVNIVYCGLSGSSTSGYISSIKKLYSTGSDGHGHNDMRYMLDWGGYSSSVIKGLNTTNTRVGTLYRDGHIVVGGKTVATGTWITARFSSGSGFKYVKSGVWARKSTTSMMHSSDKVLITFDKNGKAIAGTVIRCGNMIRFTPKSPVKVCNPATGEIISVPRPDESKYEPVDSPKCKDLKACRLSDKTIVTLKQAEYDKNPSAYSKNLADCQEVPPVVTHPGVSIVKTVNGAETAVVDVNEPFTYELVVKNTGDVELKSVVVSDTAPAGIQFISADKGTVTNNTFSYTIPSLAVGGSETIKITAKATVASATPVKNTACVETPTVPGTNPDDCDDATTTTPEKTPKVSIDKKVDGVEVKTVGVDTEFTYQIVVKNVGNVDLKDVVVSDKAPAGVTFLSASEGTIVSGQWSVTLAELKIGASKSFAIKAKVPTEVAGTIKNTACVETPTVPGTNPDDCDDADINVTPNPVEVCNPETGEIITVPKDDESKYLPKDSPKCEKMKVCIINSGDTTMQTISKDEFDASKHSTNPEDCKKPETPVVPETPETPATPETPTVLPSTGPEAILGGITSASALTYGAYSYVASRRALKAARN